MKKRHQAEEIVRILRDVVSNSVAGGHNHYWKRLNAPSEHEEE